MKSLIRASAVALSLMCASTAWAVPELSLPWPCDISYNVTQGHNTGSHTGKGGWAWDLGMPKGSQVVAVADGVIRRVKQDSTRFGCSNSYANDGNYVVLDFEDGTEALYLHLRAGSVPVSPGQRVQRGDVLGEVGESGWICGVHLHFQIQQTCSSWYCQSIQANFDMFGDPGFGTRLTSQNCGAPPDCTLSDGERVVDERDGCFRKSTEWWWEEAGGHDGAWIYTYAIAQPTPDAQAWWTFEVTETATIDLDVHIPPGAESRQAAYRVTLDGQELGPFVLDQTQATGWVPLHSLRAPAGANIVVNLADNTGEPYSQENRRRLAVDAVRARVAPDLPPEPDMGPPDNEPDMGPDLPPEPDMTEPSLDMTPDAAPPYTPPPVDMGSAPAPIPPEEPRPVDPEPQSVRIEGQGSCAITPTRPATPWWVLGLLGVMFRRRRRAGGRDAAP